MDFDLQAPPGLIAEFILCRKEGFKPVGAIKNEREESRQFFPLRKSYHAVISRLRDADVFKNLTGFALDD